VKEVWFAGVHSDVGGSYAEAESQLSKVALRWMLCEAEGAGLRIDQQKKQNIFGADPRYVAPDPLTANQHESLKGAWWIAELWPKIAHVKGADGSWKRHVRLNLGRRRWIAPNSVVHDSVQQRLASPTLKYRPPNLPQQVAIATDSCVENAACDTG
jgi:uncharacterized protein (DUF2235 family)